MRSWTQGGGGRWRGEGPKVVWFTSWLIGAFQDSPCIPVNEMEVLLNQSVATVHIVGQRLLLFLFLF